MAEPVTKLDATGTILLMWCVPCDGPHGIMIDKDNPHSWNWNGDFEKPTISPSIHVVSYPGHQPRCHSFVKDGTWLYLDDCGHDKRGTTQPMLPVSEWSV